MPPVSFPGRNSTGDNRHETQWKTGVYLFFSEHGTPGFKAVPMHRKLMWRASSTAELYFDNVRIPKENILGNKGDGFHQMLQTLDGGRLSIAAMGLGGAQGAYEAGLKYARERQQFGQPSQNFRPSLSSWQTVPWR